MKNVILNGELIRAELARLPVSDRLIRSGERIEVAIQIRNAIPLRLEQHINRLADTLSAPEVSLPYAASRRLLARDIATLCAHDDLYEGIARFVITPGESPDLLPSLQNPPRVTTLLWLEDNAERRKQTENGVRLSVSPYPRLRGDKLARLALGRSGRDLAAVRMALREQFDGTVVCDERGCLLDAVDASLFAVCDGALVTPHPEKDGVYPEIYRDLVIECAARLGIMMYQEPLTPDICARASEFFLASCLHEIAPIRELGWRKFNDHAVALKLLLACRDRLLTETAPV